MALWGLSEDDLGEPSQSVDLEIYVWDENRLAYEVFCFMDTQWRSDFNGRYGLDYAVLYKKLDRMQLKPEAYEQLFEDVRTMEFAHLEAVAEHRRKEDAKKETKKPR